MILDAITVDEELEVQEEVTLEHLPEAVLQDIICISGWLVEYGRNQGRSPTLYTLSLNSVPSHFSFSVVPWSMDSTRVLVLYMKCTHSSIDVRFIGFFSKDADSLL